MERKTWRVNRSNLASRAIEGCFGWCRDPYTAEVVPEWTARFPNLPIVADGREETGHTRAGRGTTAFDLFRRIDGRDAQDRVVRGIRVDFLSIKTDTIASDGKLPSKLELSTGNEATLRAILEGIERGAALPTIVFASENDENGDPMEEGFAIFLDLGPILRRGIAGIDNGPYGKGEAPEAYFKWSSARPCGGKAKKLAREDYDFPHVDEQGRRWIAADKVCYSELVVSLSSLGYKRSHWIPCQISDLARLCEDQDWNRMALGE